MADGPTRPLRPRVRRHAEFVFAVVVPLWMLSGAARAQDAGPTYSFSGYGSLGVVRSSDVVAFSRAVCAIFSIWFMAALTSWVAAACCWAPRLI